MLNVLLMLSSTQPPDPLDEVAWHVENLATNDITYFATAQALRPLPRGGAVAFYGDQTLGHRLLGVGRFRETVEIRSQRGLDIAARQCALYSKNRLPASALTWVGVDHLHVDLKRTLESLYGVIASQGASNGLPLTLANLPEGQARRCVYFTTAQTLQVSRT